MEASQLMQCIITEKKNNHPTPNLQLSEHGHVAYKIKWDYECSNIFCPHTPTASDPGGGVKTFFSESSHVACQIRREWNIEHHAIIYLFSHTTSTAGVGSKVIIFFIKAVVLHIKLKGMEHRAS